MRRVLSLCTGYGGLDLGAFGMDHRPMWVSEIDPAACRVLERNWSDVPNLGSLDAIAWEELGRIDHITAGFPCQPVSQAGKGKGTDDERWLWPHIAEGLGRLLAAGSRPTVWLENVRGLLGREGGRYAQVVLRSLSDLGYVCRWGVVRASDAGACHRRERVFILATHADAAGRGAVGVGVARDGSGESGEPQAVGEPGRRSGVDLLPTPTAMQLGGTVEQFLECKRRAGISPTVSALNMVVEQLLPTPRAQNGETRNSRVWLRESGPQNLENGLAHAPIVYDSAAGWGRYADAIARHEQVFGRPAPDPVDDKRRLSPRFVEWMMMLPEGWVTDCDISRTAQLRILGNGVVPAQACLAYDIIATLPFRPPGKSKS